ncbi:MAG: sulfotransferase [Planctomycetota bacterium]
MPPSPTKVLYVMGAGRSGSTVLGIALGQLRRVFYGGEMHSWFIFEGHPKSDRPETKELWERVRKRVSGAEPYFGMKFSRNLEHHRSLFKRPGPELVEAHRSLTGELMRAIRTETDADWVVDTSHYPRRAALLRDNPELETHVIHLIRHPVDVIDALQKNVQRKRPMGVPKANAYMATVGFLSELEYRRFDAKRRIRVRYEDFLDDPVATLRAICERFGIDAQPLTATDIPTGHVFQGNRVRERESITITPQPKKRVMGRLAHVASTMVQSPLIAHHRLARR